MSSYTIYCKICEDDVTLEFIGDGEYLCRFCQHIYTDEDGVIDREVAADYFAQYRGAKRAGLIPDPEWKEFDKENTYHG